MSVARSPFRLTGPGVDRGYPSIGVAISASLTYAVRHQEPASFYVRDVGEVVVGRSDTDGEGNVQTHRVDGRRPRDEPGVGASSARARLSEAGTVPVVEPQRQEVTMPTQTGAKRTTAKRLPASKRKPAMKRIAAPAAKKSNGELSPALKAAVAVLRRQPGNEMKVSEIARAVVSGGKVKLAGKTPEATVGAQIYVAAKKGVAFKKTTRGHVALIS